MGMTFEEEALANGISKEELEEVQKWLHEIYEEEE